MIYTITNQKGGVGKSTTAAALGAGLKAKGYKVLFIDLDAQANLTFCLQAKPQPLSSLEVLTKTAKAAEAIQHTEQGDIIPAAPALAAADSLLTNTGKEYRLREALKPVLKDYDYIIIDTPPSLSTLTINALTASNKVIIPVQADAFSLQGVASLQETIEAVQAYCNPDLIIAGLVITRYNSRTLITKQMTDYLNEIAAALNTKVFNTKVRECTAIKEAQTLQQDILTYAPKSNAAADYTALLNEIEEG